MQIQKSIAAYFSKYAGKDASPTLKKKGFHEVYTPSRWWGSSSVVKKEITASRRKWVLDVSTSTGRAIQKTLKNWLTSPQLLKSYGYEFDLGKSKNGTRLGSGEVDIYYYPTNEFERMQTWEEYVWEDVCMMAVHADMVSSGDVCVDIPDTTQTSQMYYADMTTTQTLPPPLASKSKQPKALSCKVSAGERRTLQLRARLLEYLSQEGECQPTVSEPEQLSLDLGAFL